MPKLRTILQSKNIIFIGLLFYVIYFAYFYNYKSKYNNENIISGRVINYKIKEGKATITIKGKEKIVASYYYKDLSEIKNLEYGSYITAQGMMGIPNKNTITNNFNYKKYLYNHKIYKTFKVNGLSMKKSNNLFYLLKNMVYKRVDKLKAKSYVNALVLGNKNYLDEDELSSIKSNGIMHLFAVSGMHVSLLVGILEKLFKRFNKIIKSILIISLVFLYAFLVGFSASILRVSIGLVILLITDSFKIKIPNIKRLIICLVIMLILNPLYIFDIGFIYSFTLMFFIYLYNINTDNKLLSLLKLSLLTFCISAPITIYNFYEINILSLFINIIFIPIVSFLIFPLSFITLIFPIFDNVLLRIFEIFFYLNRSINKINIFKVTFGKPSLILIIILYIFIYLFKYNKKYLKHIFVLIIIIFISVRLNSYHNIVYFDVKQGDSSAIITPYNRKVTLIDTGGIVSFNNNSYNISDNIITFLKSKGISKINYLILTHGDYDHMGETINLVNNFKVEKVIFNCGEFNNLEKELIKVLDKKHIKYYSCIKELSIDKNKLYFLQTREYDNENNNSNVIYTGLVGYKFMFMGDAGIEKEKDILEKYNILDVDVLKVGHHGSKTSSGKEFINEMNPKHSIISVGKNNKYGHPNKEVLNTLSNSKVYRTDQDGSIMFKIKNNKLKIETCEP